MSRSANIQEVSELLDAERAALLQGDFKALEHLITRKEKFREALERHPPSLGAMEMLQKRFEHNQMLLAAASDPKFSRKNAK
jgi:methylase of polypeptide subunit release factors